MRPETEDFKTAARETFLKPAFKNDCNFWRLGNSFDTVIDYFLACPDSGV